MLVLLENILKTFPVMADVNSYWPGSKSIISQAIREALLKLLMLQWRV